MVCQSYLRTVVSRLQNHSQQVLSCSDFTTKWFNNCHCAPRRLEATWKRSVNISGVTLRLVAVTSLPSRVLHITPILRKVLIYCHSSVTAAHMKFSWRWWSRRMKNLHNHVQTFPSESVRGWFGDPSSGQPQRQSLNNHHQHQNAPALAPLWAKYPPQKLGPVSWASCGKQTSEARCSEKLMAFPISREWRNSIQPSFFDIS